MPVLTLTQNFINNISSLPGKTRTEYCDTVVRGLYAEARATAPGQATFYCRYKDASGTTRHAKLGTTPTMTLSAARAAAKQQQAEIRLGADPRKAQREQKTVPTLQAFVDDQYLPYVKPRKRSYRDDENRLRQHILPRFGPRPINTITRKEVVDFHLELRALGLAPATCDRFLSLFRYVFNLALQWGVVASNPISKVALYLEPNAVEHYLTDQQLGQLLMVLQTYHNRPVAGLFMFLLSTGARLNEAMTAQWDQFDLEQATWRIPAATSKSRKVRPVPLNATALTVLVEQQPDSTRRSGAVFVKSSGQPIKSVQRAWESVRASAGVPFLRLHDLRHLYASMLVNAGRSLYEVQQVLGHSSPMVTQRYAHLTTRTLQDAAASASTRLQAAMPRLLPAPGTTTPTTAP